MNKKTILSDNISEIINDLQDEFNSVFGTDRYELMLYGSYSRGDDNEGSDIDILLLYELKEKIQKIRMKYIPIISRLSLKYDTLISIMPVQKKVFESAESPLFMNIRREGIKL